MKKLMTVVFTLLIAGSMAFAQTGGGSTGDKDAKTASGKKGSKVSKSKKTDNKSKKGSASTTPPPKAK